MLNLERIFQQDRLLRAMTGLNLKAFESLVPSFAQVYEHSRVNPDIERKRAVGGGRKATLRTPREKLFYILLYCKCYPTFDLLSVLFGFDRSLLAFRLSVQILQDLVTQSVGCNLPSALLTV